MSAALDTGAPTAVPPSPTADTRHAHLWFWGPFLLGAVLRLLAAVLSSPTPGDDAGRLMTAGRWALAPHWFGLSGIWSPLHTYLLGGLILLGGSPIFWAKLVGWVTTTAALPLFFVCVRDLYGSTRQAGLATLLLAVYYVHVWLAGTAFAEGPYTVCLLAGLWGAIRATRGESTHRARDAWIGGLCFAVAILLRHEAKVVWLVVVPWLYFRAGRGAMLRFAIPSGIAFAWQMLEPSIRGTSFMSDVDLVTRWKVAEVAMRGSKLAALSRWIVMPGGSPSFVVLLLGVAGLWLARRRRLRSDLFALMFLAQVGVFLALSIYPGWQPYLRYMFLYFLCLLPHAAQALDRLRVRWTWAVPALVAAVVLVQAVAWTKGRNPGRTLGWLPVFREAPEQPVLDRWVARNTADSLVFCLPGYPQTWDVTIALLRSDRCDLLPRFQELSYDELGKLKGNQALDLAEYNVLLLDPKAPRFQAVWGRISARARVEERTPRLWIVRVPPAR
jgi:hypothetical protein